MTSTTLPPILGFLRGTHPWDEGASPYLDSKPTYAREDYKYHIVCEFSKSFPKGRGEGGGSLPIKKFLFKVVFFTMFLGINAGKSGGQILDLETFPI